MTNVYFSNRVEVLYQRLKHDLFTGTGPFTKRLILVPSPAIQSWLMMQLAEDQEVGIAAGIDVAFVDPAIRRITQLAQPNSHGFKQGFDEPTELELSLALEQEILSIIKQFTDMTESEQKKWGVLLNYLHIPLTDQLVVTTKKSLKRLSALSRALAGYFIRYGTFGGLMIDTWNVQDNQEWQPSLWKRMERFFSLWNYPCRKLETIVKEGGLDQAFKGEDLHLYAFGLSYLPPLYHRFLMNVAQSVPFHTYLLSPCQKFWSDLLSDKESLKLKTYWQKRGVAEGQARDLDEYLRDRNPLLANFGKLGREMSLMIEESQVQSVETYVLPSALQQHAGYLELLDEEPIYYENQGQLTLLEAIQADLALLRNPDGVEPISFDTYDRTIQVHAAPKPMREVEAIYDAIMAILDQRNHKGDSVQPSDVIVMAPNIAEYAPFICSVFGSPESPISYQIQDVETLAKDPFIQGFLHLLALPSGRWDADSLIRLFEYPAFQKKHKLSPAEVKEFGKWITIAKVRWGSDAHHRNELLKRDHCSNEMFANCWNGTWETGLGRLLEGMVMFSKDTRDGEAESLFTPLERVETTQAELLGKVIHLLRSLLEDLRPLNDGSTLSAKEWALYLKCLSESYFSAEGSEEDEEALASLMQQVQVFESVTDKLKEAAFEFFSIESHFLSALDIEGVNHRQLPLHGVRFCSLLPMRAIPAKVLVLMGMDDGAFPRQGEKSMLNCLLQNKEADYYPSQVDFDRYLFLESLLSARQFLILSYVSVAKADGKEQSPSLIVREFLSYLDKAYHIPEKKVSEWCLVKHSLLPFDKRYFSKDADNPTYSKRYYAAAYAHYAPQKSASHQFFSDFNCLTLADQPGANEVTVDLSELIAFARHPLKSYFNKSLGIYFESEQERKMVCDEELEVSSLDAALISREALFVDQISVLKSAERTGRLPHGPFKEIGSHKIRKEATLLKTNLESLGVGVKEVVSLEFSDRFRSVSLSSDTWQMPGLDLVTPRGIKVKIVGKMEMVSTKGLIVFQEDKLKEAVKAWPVFLAFCCLIKHGDLPAKPSLLFIKGRAGKAKLADFENPEELLGHYLDYYTQAKLSASPLLPDWVEPILKGDHEELKGVIASGVDDSFQIIYDDCLKWMARNAPNVGSPTTVQNWQVTAECLFKEMVAAWYSKSANKVKGAAVE